MKEIDFMSSLHKSTTRDYLGRVNDPEFPKPTAALIAKKFGQEYWDGDRRICYGGYHYIRGRWTDVARSIIKEYKLVAGYNVLDIGCGKGYLLYELQRLVPGLKVFGLDISDYAINNAKEEVKQHLTLGCASALPWGDNKFDLVISIGTLHNLYAYDLEKSLREVERVGKQNKYLCVESYRSEQEKANLLYWQLTCEAFNTPEEWIWWFLHCGYTGDYSFIYFE